MTSFCIYIFGFVENCVFKCSSQLYGLLPKRFYNCFDLRSVTVAVLLFCKLNVVKFVIESAFSEQLLVCALFNDVAVLHNKDNIAFLDC